ncbi:MULTISPECIES: hypothetical protein [unclassified Bradyrhizobium]|uniref:hypothetical protein n=1 Tax=unclassified Bradyrhizobium TaxID=2631580 RepID=UPI0024795205|nr:MULTISPECIES: hypothetical protein [unclassified Bradyrhizobium]WGR72689.1 hypothetical protein MTX24_07145 [Bradyrhizobium sp. ISRA426]WGR77522.1 hypothetical protein MTX21_32095 [Bradyrhizobium sp. ISRA430]WGR87928.1 hypothetical protein MTX25_07145 [Bradyrhizobium sp. ISRA432]
MREAVRQWSGWLWISLSGVLLSGCATVVPNFDIPADQNGPTIHSISRRVSCELVQLIERGDAMSETLLGDDMVVAVQLNLTVNDTGGLSPSLTYVNAPFAFGLGGALSQSREQNFTQKYYYSVRALRKEAAEVRKLGGNLAECWPTDTNLAGELGLKRTVELALTAQHVAWDKKLSDDGGVFGGYVNFVVTKNVNGGPIWTLTSFVGPGSTLGSFSEVNTDKLTFAFARGDKAGTLFRESGRVKADRLIEQININQLTTQLSGVRPLR